MYLGVFGSGLGHASRMVTVGRRLAEEGNSLVFSSSGESTAYIRRHGFVCNDLPLVDVVFTGEGSFSAKETTKMAPLIFGRLFRQVGLEGRNLARFAPDVVLSDSVISTVMAAKLGGIRTVTVMNQLRLVSSPRTPRIASALLSTGSITVGNEFWELTDRMLLPDLPPPYTISERNLWGAGSVGSRAEYIGFLPPPRSYAADGFAGRVLRDRRKKIFWLISGPPKTRASLLPKVRALAKSLGERFVSVISAGNPLGSGEPQEVAGGYFFDWCPYKDELVDKCDVLVSRAGHTTISDFILRGKPSILIPIQSHSEQTGNADKAERLGVAVRLEESGFTAAAFDDALSRVSSEKVKKGAARMCEIANRYDAVESIVDAVVA